MSVSSHDMGGACASTAKETITHDMNGLCRSRHSSARLADPVPHLLLAHRDELEMPDDSVLVDKEGARKAEHAIAKRCRAIRVQDRLETVESERVEERPRLIARLQEIDLEHDHVGLARGDALECGHLAAARRTPGGPEIHNDHLAAIGGQAQDLAVGARPFEIRGRRANAAGGPVGLNLGADDAFVADLRRLVQDWPEKRGQRFDNDRADDDRRDPARERGRLALGFRRGRQAHPTSGRKLKSWGSRANWPATRTRTMTITSVTPARF